MVKGVVRMKAKCAHCNTELEQEHSDSWKLYCNDAECKKVFMQEALKPVGRKRK